MSSVMSYFLLDVLDEVLLKHSPAFRGNPLWQLLVPHQTMTAKLKSVLLCKSKQIVGWTEIELARRGFRGLPLQFIFGNDQINLTGNKIAKSRIVRNLTLLNGSAIHDRAGTSSPLQRSDGCGVGPSARSDIGVTAATCGEQH